MTNLKSNNSNQDAKRLPEDVERQMDAFLAQFCQLSSMTAQQIEIYFERLALYSSVFVAQPLCARVDWMGRRVHTLSKHAVVLRREKGHVQSEIDKALSKHGQSLPAMFFRLIPPSAVKPA